MTLKELAHLAQQTLHTPAGCPVKRSHVHELLAAAFGHRFWAAFLSDSVLADSGVGAAPTGGLPDLIGRAVQLGYEQQAAATVAITLQAFIAKHRLSAVSLADLRAALLPAVQVADRDDLDDDDDDDDIDDDDEVGRRTAQGCVACLRSRSRAAHRLADAAEQSRAGFWAGESAGALPAGRSLPLRPAESLPLRGVAQGARADRHRARLG